MKRFCLTALVLGLCCTTAPAQEQEGKNAFSEWLKKLQGKIAQIVPKKSISMSTGAAGVRSAKEDSPVKLYWKGKKGEDAVTEEEMAAFKAGIDLAEKDDKDGAIQQLDQFMKQYPDSALIPDVKRTFDLVSAMPKAEPKPEETTETKSEQKADEKKEKKE